jgi:23S rRNA (pseudouridine1915-N3)-methyltransferase
MHLSIIAVGQRMPDWVQSGYTEYSKRLPSQFSLKLIEIPAVKRGGNNARAIEEEGARVLQAITADTRVIVLDERGKSWQTRELSKAMDDWLHDGRDVAFVIGGADGHAESVRQRAERLWSLSALTLPHGMVRVVLAEQLYRAWSLLQGHPYHRD